MGGGSGPSGLRWWGRCSAIGIMPTAGKPCRGGGRPAMGAANASEFFALTDHSSAKRVDLKTDMPAGACTAR